MVSSACAVAHAKRIKRVECKFVFAPFIAQKKLLRLSNRLVSEGVSSDGGGNRFFLHTPEVIQPQPRNYQDFHCIYFNSARCGLNVSGICS
jgi:hypothetical protein